MINIDFNCDMGESYGNYVIGNDEQIMPYITSCNIACGFHGGDPMHIEKTLKNAKEHNLRIGAHPGYPDLNGFGRRYMQLSEDELRTCIKYQVAALVGMGRSLGIPIAYVKPHGALYNKIADDENESRIVIQAILDIDATLSVMGLAGSKTELACHALGVPFIAEAFADRRYTDQGRLASRREPGAVIHDPKAAKKQVSDILEKNLVETVEGNYLNIKADTYCVHGDNKNAVAILREIHKELIK